MEGNGPPRPQGPQTITNFCIDTILRPDFGLRRKQRTEHPEAGEETRRSPKAPSPGAGDPKAPRPGAADPKAPRPGAADPKAPRPGAADQEMLWPAWVYCTRYSDRPSAGPRSRRTRREAAAEAARAQDKRPRTAFTAAQLQRLRGAFQEDRYLTEQRRAALARELQLEENQVKIWFQNKRAKAKKARGGRNALALHLMAQGLYNHAASRDSD